MSKLEVFCTVNNCHYWDDGNLCGADKILITLDRIGKQFDNTDGAQIQSVISQAGHTPADHSVETCCQTFRPRAGQDDGTLRL